MERKRLAWVDIAKAIAMLCVIVGHVYPSDHPIHNLIFSFHMPLFFILSGYTSRAVSDGRELWKRTRQDMIRLLLPCAITSLLYLGQRYVATIFGMNDEGIMDVFGSWPASFFWASGTDLPNVRALGAVWFLVALFWVRFLYAAVRLTFPGKYGGILFLFSALAGVGISKTHWLPQNMDIVLVAVAFYWIGVLCRDHIGELRKDWLPIALGAFLYWMICFQRGIYLEMATRDYPYFVISLAEAVAGSACIILLAKAMERSLFSAPLSSLGKHTLLVLCVHKLDCFLIWGGVVRDALSVGKLCQDRT